MAKVERPSVVNPNNSLPPGWGFQLSPMVRKLFDAIEKCRYKKLKYLIQTCAAKITSKNECGQTVLIVALHIEDPDNRHKMFRYLLKQGANPLVKDTTFGRNCLLWACVLCCPGEARYLLHEYSGELDIAEGDTDGFTALHHAVLQRSMEVVRILIDAFYKYRLSVDIPDRLGLTPYMQARRLGHYQIAQVLKEEGRASPHRRDAYWFKSGTEWSQVGRKEREEEDKDKMRKEIAWIKVLGRAPKLRTGFGLPVRKKGRQFVRLPPILREDCEEKESAILSEPVQDGKSTSLSNRSLPEHLLSVGENQVGDTNKVTFSLLDLTETGRRVKHFHKSQTIDTGSNSDLSVLENISSLLDILVEQSCDSFRKSVEKPEVIPDVQVPKKKQKVSSLAIVMGRKRGDKSRKPRPDKREIQSNRLSVIEEARTTSKNRRGSRRASEMADNPTITNNLTVNEVKSSVIRSPVPEIKIEC